MRIGTWNLAGRWDARHLALLEVMDCEVVLLTEVSDRVSIPAMAIQATELQMARRRYWAAVASRREMKPLGDAHGASATAEIGGLRFCSSILPWRGCGPRAPWVGSNTAERTIDAVTAIESFTPDVWGGDWNHAITGREYAGSIAGRSGILAGVEHLGLAIATAAEPHCIDGLLSIDHIAVPASWTVKSVERHVAAADGKRLSDHDAYVVEADPL